MQEERASKAAVGCTPDARPQIYIMMIIMTMLIIIIIINDEVYHDDDDCYDDDDYDSGDGEDAQPGEGRYKHKVSIPPPRR